MMGYYWGNMTGFGLSGSIMMILFWAAIIIFIVWVVKEIGGKNHEKPNSNSALVLLKERYAKGEINKQEFEEKKKDIV